VGKGHTLHTLVCDNKILAGRGVKGMHQWSRSKQAKDVVVYMVFGVRRRRAQRTYKHTHTHTQGKKDQT